MIADMPFTVVQAEMTGMHAKRLTPILNVSDIEESFAWFGKLGWKKGWEWGDPPTFGGVWAGECEVFLCQGGQGGRGHGGVKMTFGAEGDQTADKGAWMSVWVDDVDAVHRHCLDQGLDVAWPPTDMPWGVREMHVRHPDGHVFRISQQIEDADEAKGREGLKRDRVEVRHATPADAASLARLRHALWPDGSEAEHRQELDRLLADPSPSGAILVATGASGLVAFAEVSIRAYAEGCRTDRVGYLEGWFVDAGARRHGVGRELVTAAETWARSQGCVEFASDAEADNVSSAAAHRALGFAEVGLIRCFRKDLPSGRKVVEAVRARLKSP